MFRSPKCASTTLSYPVACALADRACRIRPATHGTLSPEVSTHDHACERCSSVRAKTHQAFTTTRLSCPFNIPLNPSFPARRYAAGDSENAVKFNCVQRGHQQALETYPMFLVLSIIGGIKHPVTTALAGVLWIHARREASLPDDM